MIMGYKEDRAYTDYNHKLAEEQIYATYGISIYKPQTEEEKQRAVNDDIYKAIDYIGFIEKSGKPFAIQERTRSVKAAAYNDITIRFERPDNPNADRVQSEAYKLNYFFYQNPDVPFLMMYAVRGEDKNIASISMDSFIKYAFIDLRKLYYLIQNGNIVFEPWNMSMTQAYYAIRQIKEDLRQFAYNFPPLAVPNTPIPRHYQNPQKGLGITI